MRTLASYPGHFIFLKTEKGRDEMAQRCFGLDMRHRRILIMMDGSKSLSAIREMMPKDDLETIISFLMAQGFIAANQTSLRKTARVTEGTVLVRDTADKRMPPAQVASVRRHVTHDLAQPTSMQTQSAPPPGPAKLPARSLDTGQIRQVKDFMTTTATTYLGLLSADIIRRIERADNGAQLLTVVGPWHMALRESKQGNRFAGPYLEQVTAALAGKEMEATV